MPKAADCEQKGVVRTVANRKYMPPPKAQLLSVALVPH